MSIQRWRQSEDALLPPTVRLMMAARNSSDLRRAAETAETAFADCGMPVLLDWRLRECDYGELNARPLAEQPSHRATFPDEPYPGGESWRQAATRVYTLESTTAEAGS